MKITDLTATLFSWDDIPSHNIFNLGRGKGYKHDQALIDIATDEGLHGYAFLGKSIDPASSDAASLVKILKPIVMGKDPLDREAIYQTMWRRRGLTTVRAVGAVDVALWDLAGKIAGLPIHKLMGGCRDKIGVYCSSDHNPSDEAYCEEAVRYKEMGWQGYKIHPWGPGPVDIKLCTAVRKAVGDGYPLMIDSTALYDYDEALKVGRALEELDYLWYEDPLTQWDIYNYQKLREKLDIPIMATERPDYGFDTYAIWVTSRATDYLRGDVALKGGLTCLLKTAHLAEAFKLKYEVHTGGNSLNNLAHLQIEMAIRNTTFHEILMPEAVPTYALLNEPVPDKEGFIRPPPGPGLGAEIDFKLIERKKIGVLE